MAKLFGLMLLLLLTGLAQGATPGADVKSVGALHSRLEFDALARTVDTPYPLPHVLFVLDRQDGNQMYYVNSKRYALHRDFVNSAYLSLERGQKFFADNYLSPNRRFLMGTVAYQTPIKRWTFEFWEGDQISPQFIQLASDTIRRTFFTPVAYKPNSLQQEEASASLPGLTRILADQIVKPSDYQPLNKAHAVGRLHIIAQADDKIVIAPDDIIVLDQAPVTLPPVVGIVTTQPASPLSHINLRAKAAGIPNAYIAHATQLFQRFNGQLVSFETRSDQYLIGKPTAKELAQRQAEEARRRIRMTPHSDLSVTSIAGLHAQRANMVIAYGAKSANLGEMMHTGLSGAEVPDGFTLPFAAYDQFLRENHLEEPITAMLHDPQFRLDPTLRRQRLAQLRARITQGQMNPILRAQVLAQARAQFAGQGLFVRSSTNSEDLLNFNGAGLYTTVPNVRGDDQLLAAIKTVWASVWNFEAYEAREQAGVDHRKVYMAVLIQKGINADSAGVMITTDPYDPLNTDAIYISAKRGLGIKVVEGNKIPEQLIYNTDTNAVHALTRSAEDSLLTFDAHGGVREVAVTGKRAVLTDDLVHRLAGTGGQIRRIFGGKPQDIEWAILNGKVYIVQSRPYIESAQ